jgi:hypothetical protein
MIALVFVGKIKRRIQAVAQNDNRGLALSQTLHQCLPVWTRKILNSIESGPRFLQFAMGHFVEMEGTTICPFALLPSN